MTRTLLIGLGDVGALSGPRQDLVDLVVGLRALGVATQVAAFADGPVPDALGAVADVARMEPLARRSVGGVAEGAVRRIEPRAARPIQDLRSRAGRRRLRHPDAVHLHGVEAMPVLRYLDRWSVPVTVHVHPWDHAISSLPPRDRRDLVARTTRFLVADESVVDGLLAAGVEPDRIELAPPHDDLVPPPPPTADDARRRRTSLGLPVDRPVLAVPPVPDWGSMPDLTLAVAWELARRHTPDRPLVLWYGMPADPERAWPVADDIARSGLHDVLVDHRHLPWADVLELADAVVLPLAGRGDLPEGFARDAARAARPVLCWQGDPRAGEVTGWGGSAVARGDVACMVDRVGALVGSAGARRRSRVAAFRRAVADLERLVPIGVEPP